MPETLRVQRFDEHPIWGDCVFAEALVDDAETIRDAYTEASPAWPSLHFAVATPAQLDAWHRLGFAQMHAYGVASSGGAPFGVPGVSLRRGGLDDLETAMRIDDLINAAQAASPSYSSYRPDPAEHRQTWVETLEADDVTYTIAERDGRTVGHVTLYPDPQHAGALHLASTAVVPEANLAASRYWPARGFELTHVRLVRRLPDL